MQADMFWLQHWLLKHMGILSPFTAVIDFTKTGPRVLLLILTQISIFK
jgi:hypothetical protein